MDSKKLIKEVNSDEEVECCTVSLRASFKDIADDFGLTEENASSNAAFITIDKLKDSIIKGIRLFAMMQGNRVVGTIAMEKSRENEKLFFLEKLAVIPEARHKGYGKELLDYAFNVIRNNGGKMVSIGIINENALLKNWYFRYGFVEKGLKKFDHLPFSVCFMEKSAR